MFGYSTGAQAYATVGAETGVAAATPHHLIVMLFDGADAAIANAIAFMKAGQFEQKGHQVTKAMNIVQEGLRASLDKEKGGEVALHLDDLYGYIYKTLYMGSLKNSPDQLQQARDLLAGLRDAWVAIGNQPKPSGAEASATEAAAAQMARA